MKRIIIPISILALFSCEEPVKIDGYPNKTYKTYDIVVNSTDQDIVIDFVDYNDTEKVIRTGQYEIKANQTGKFNVKDNGDFGLHSSDSLKITFSDGNMIQFRSNSPDNMNPMKGVNGVLVENDNPELEYVKFEVEITDELYIASKTR